MNARISGWMLLTLWALVSIEQVHAGVPHVLVAFCYIGVLVASLGFLFERTELVVSYLSAALIAQTLFAVDLLLLYLGGSQVFGFVDYNPLELTIVGRIADLAVHLLVLPVTLLGLRSLKPTSYLRFVSTYSVLAASLFVLSFVTGMNCTQQRCYEPLAYGGTLLGHVLYGSLAWIVVPLVTALLVITLHRRVTS